MRRAIPRISAFYELQVDLVRDTLADRISSGDALLLVRLAYAELILTQSQLVDLSHLNGAVSIPLTRNFYLGRQNVRISNVSVVDQPASSVSLSGNVDYPAIVLRMSLGEDGNFNVKSSPTYYYPTAGNLFTWEHSFVRGPSGDWQSQDNSLSPDVKGLLTVLVGEKDSSVIQFSPIFSSHAGLTNLLIKTTLAPG